MNTFGYIVRRLARTFGYKNEQERLVNARREGMLLNEAEYLLGQFAWKDVEHIEELADEYWKILEVDGQLAKLQTEIRGLENENERLAALHKGLEEEIAGDIMALTSEKTRKMQGSIALMHEAQDCRAGAEATRKKFDGLKTKHKVLSEKGGTSEELDGIALAMRELKSVYNEDRKRLADITSRIREAEAAAVAVEKKIVARREESRQKLAAMMSELGKSSNVVAQHSARIGALERTRRDLVFAVGTYLSRNSQSKDPIIRPVVRKHRGIVAKISVLQQSINYNRILSGRVE
jgi:chromosome segregation ATPase